MVVVGTNRGFVGVETAQSCAAAASARAMLKWRVQMACPPGPPGGVRVRRFAPDILNTDELDDGM